MTDRESEQLDYQQPATLEAARARIEQLERQLQAERERRREIEANERCFRELAEHIREVIWMTDETGDELVYVCPAYEKARTREDGKSTILVEYGDFYNEK